MVSLFEEPPVVEEDDVRAPFLSVIVPDSKELLFRSEVERMKAGGTAETETSCPFDLILTKGEIIKANRGDLGNFDLRWRVPIDLIHSVNAVDGVDTCFCLTTWRRSKQDASLHVLKERVILCASSSICDGWVATLTARLHSFWQKRVEDTIVSLPNIYQYHAYFFDETSKGKSVASLVVFDTENLRLLHPNLGQGINVDQVQWILPYSAVKHLIRFKDSPGIVKVVMHKSKTKHVPKLNTDGLIWTFAGGRQSTTAVQEFVRLSTKTGGDLTVDIEDKA